MLWLDLNEARSLAETSHVLTLEWFASAGLHPYLSYKHKEKRLVG